MEDVLDHLGGELALLGLGSLGLERWGRALVLTVEGAPSANSSIAYWAPCSRARCSGHSGAVAAR